MANRLSYNIHAQGVKDTPRLLAHLAKLKPTWAGVMNGVRFAQEIHNASPNTQVWHRAYPEGGDETIWKRLSPGEWVTRTATELKDTGLWAYCLNEPGFDDEMLIWLCNVIELAQPLGLKLVVGNFSVGTPEPNQWNKASARRLLELCDKYRATVALGLHEYAGGVITSGFVGGAPNSTQYHPDYIPVANWPNANDARELTMWHIGRVKIMVNACKAMGIKAPRVLITEFGFDSLKSDPNPDLRAWLDNLPTENGLEARAWKGLRAAWAKYYPTLAHEEAFHMQLAYADCIIYHDALPVEGMQLFCYGAAGNDWIHFDVEGHDALARLLELHECEKSATANKPNEPPAPVELPEETTPIPAPSLERRALFGVLASIGRARTELTSYYQVVCAELDALQANVENALKSVQ